MLFEAACRLSSGPTVRSDSSTPDLVPQVGCLAQASSPIKRGPATSSSLLLREPVDQPPLALAGTACAARAFSRRIRLSGRLADRRRQHLVELTRFRGRPPA